MERGTGGGDAREGVTARGERGVGDLTWYEGERWPKVSWDGDEGSG